MRLAFSEITIESYFQSVASLPKNNINQDASSLGAFARIANENDEEALKIFHKAVFSKDDSASEVYSRIALSCGRTYVFDVSGNEPCILSALTVVPNSKGEKYLLFCGTIPLLRNKGLFSALLSAVEETEKREHGGFKGIFIPNSLQSFAFMKARGFVNEAFGLECVLNGDNKKHDFRKGIYAGADYMLCNGFHLENSGLSVEAFSLMYKYFSHRGGIFGQTADGYVAFVEKDLIKREILKETRVSEKAEDSESKGNFIICECAISAKELNKLPSAFQSCVLPIWKKDQLKKAKIPFETVITAISNFPIENRFIYGVQRFF